MLCELWFDLHVSYQSLLERKSIRQRKTKTVHDAKIYTFIYIYLIYKWTTHNIKSLKVGYIVVIPRCETEATRKEKSKSNNNKLDSNNVLANQVANIFIFLLIFYSNQSGSRSLFESIVCSQDRYIHRIIKEKRAK